jgi:hypothetical protein
MGAEYDAVIAVRERDGEPWRFIGDTWPHSRAQPRPSRLRQPRTSVACERRLHGLPSARGGARHARREPFLPADQPPLHPLLDDYHLLVRVSEWAELFGDEVQAVAILDPLHDAEILIIRGPGWRLRGPGGLLADMPKPAENGENAPRDRGRGQQKRSHDAD